MPGFTKSQEGADARGSRAGWQRSERRCRLVPVTRREFIQGPAGGFSGTPPSGASSSCWPCVLLVTSSTSAPAALYGEKVPYVLITMVVFLNQGLSGFVLSAIAARFIFPSVSLEGRQLWLLRSSPLD